MSFKITKSEPVGRGLKRIAAGQVTQALGTLNALSGNSHLPVDGTKVAGAIHEARTRFKKVRGLLRLARPGLGKKSFKSENRFFRDSGRRIRAVRDAVALVEALDNLVNRSFNTSPTFVIQELRKLLARDAQKLSHDISCRNAAALTALSLDQELKRVDAWKLKDLKWKDARRARRRADDVCRKAFETALAHPTDENLHEWRKRAKVLLHELQLTRKRSPKLRERTSGIESLTRLLGEDHDLALLAQTAAARKKNLKHPAQLKTLLARLSDRRRQIRTEAIAIATELYRKEDVGETCTPK